MATSESFRVNLWHPRWWPMIARAVWGELRRVEITVSLK